MNESEPFGLVQARSGRVVQNRLLRVQKKLRVKIDTSEENKRIKKDIKRVTSALVKPIENMAFLSAKHEENNEIREDLRSAMFSDSEKSSIKPKKKNKFFGFK